MYSLNDIRVLQFVLITISTISLPWEPLISDISALPLERGVVGSNPSWGGLFLRCPAKLWVHSDLMGPPGSHHLQM